MAPAAASQQQRLNIFFFPMMAPGHQIPMLDLARLLACRGMKISMVTTAVNLRRFHAVLDTDKLSGDNIIDFHVLDFPSEAVGLPKDCENFDSLPTRFMSNRFFKGIMMLQPQADDLVRQHRPDAIISDLYLPWTAEICRKYHIPRIGFQVSSCFSVCVTQSAIKYLMQQEEGENMDLETTFLVPGLPKKVYVKKSQTPSRCFSKLGMEEFFMKVAEAEPYTSGVVFNTFYEIEGEFLDYYKGASGKEVWPVGPFLLYKEKALAMGERRKKDCSDEDQSLLAWLDSKESNSVIYVCFGSLCAFAESQLVEIGLGLEASNCNFIWVIKDSGPGLEGLEERVKGRGLIIKGWAPQIEILSHRAVGGFVTHCGWNSLLEAVSFGVPVITWPLYGDHGYLEHLVVNELRMGFSIGVDTMMVWGEEEKVGALVKRDRVTEAVTRLMGGGESVEGMRRRMNELGGSARSAVKEGGSSYVNLDLLIENLVNQKAATSTNGEGIN